MADKVDLKQLIENYVGNENETERDTKMSQIINTMNKSSKILPLIMVLGEFLTSSTSNLQRQDAILIIYQTLKQCTNLHLIPSELTTIINFLCSRFEHDLVCQSYLLLTLCVLYNKYHTQLCSKSSDSDGQILFVNVMQTIINKLDYEQIKMKIKYKSKSAVNYNQLSREQYLKLLNHALINHSDIILHRFEPNDVFIDGCIRIMDSESDPRNILLLFNLFQSIFKYFSHQILSKHLRVQLLPYPPPIHFFILCLLLQIRICLKLSKFTSQSNSKRQQRTRIFLEFRRMICPKA